MDLHGGDCNWEGWPSWESLAVNKHNEAVGEPTQAYNPDLSAEGLVGDTLPTVMFYLPMYDNGTSKDRYWTYFAVPTAAMKGNREQYVWMALDAIPSDAVLMPEQAATLQDGV